MQSRRMALVESIANVIIGYLIALSTQLIVFPLLNIPVSLSENFLIGAIFTAVSLARSYCVRRMFNRLHST